METAAFLLSIILLASGICFDQTSAFTYQGKLASSGTPVSVFEKCWQQSSNYL